MSEDPFIKMRALTERVRKLGDEIGLDLANIEFVPSAQGNIVHFQMQVRPETLKTNEEAETDAMNAEFESLMGGMQIVEGEDGPSIADVEEEPDIDPVLEEKEAEMIERARQRARERLERQSDEE